MLGLHRKAASHQDAHVERASPVPAVPEEEPKASSDPASEAVDELAVQRVVVEELAAESVSRHAENETLKETVQALHRELEAAKRQTLEVATQWAMCAAALCYREDGMCLAYAREAALRAENDELEAKLSRMGRTLAQARRQAREQIVRT